MQGELFGYAPGRVAFESPPFLAAGATSGATHSSNKCILLGGLSDGLMPVPYTAALEQALSSTNWSLVQPILSSSYTGFGHGSLDRDVEELDELLSHLVEHRNAETFALVGHSTGTQDIVHYLRYGNTELRARVRAVALQAPVSDREAATVCHDDDDDCPHSSQAEHLAELQRHLKVAHQMRDQNKGDEMMPRSAFWAPITASRYLDLMEPKGRDDYFSSDLTDEELRERLGHVGSALEACLVACSGSDEYVPSTVEIEPLMHRLCRAMNSNSRSDRGTVAVPLYLPTGNHNLSSRDGADAATFVEQFKEMLQKLN